MVPQKTEFRIISQEQFKQIVQAIRCKLYLYQQAHCYIKNEGFYIDSNTEMMSFDFTEVASEELICDMIAELLTEIRNTIPHQQIQLDPATEVISLLR